MTGKELKQEWQAYKVHYDRLQDGMYCDPHGCPCGGDGEIAWNLLTGQGITPEKATLKQWQDVADYLTEDSNA